MALTIIAEITAKDGQTEVVKAALQRLIPATRAEAGCINYDPPQIRRTQNAVLRVEAQPRPAAASRRLRRRSLICHQDNENPAQFVFYENWESRDLWQAHMNAPHMKVWGEVAEASVADWSLTEASQFE